MDNISAAEFLKDQLPSSARALIAPTLKSAYADAKRVTELEPIFKVPTAVDNRGRIVSWATDLAFERLLQTKQWNFDYRWRDFALPTGRYLEIRLSHSVLSISQVANPAGQPRDVAFRENGRLNNEPFFDLDEFKDNREVSGLPHFILVHGHQQLTFAHVGVPHSEFRRAWIYRTPNLLTMPHVVVSDLPPQERTDFQATMQLKEEIDRWRKNHDV
jgi:hypothetical protein